MKVLITGSYGFLGYSLAVKLLHAGHEVVGIDREVDAISEKTPRIQHLSSFPQFEHEECNIANYERVLQIFEKHSPQAVMHFAAQYAVAPLRPELLQRYIDSNCLGFVNILQACQRTGVKRFNYASSTFVEDHTVSTHTYGATKKFNEEMANVFSHTYDMETVGIRYGSTFGRECRTDVGIFKVAQRMFNRQKHPIKGGYLYQTAFLWSEDAVDVTFDLMLKPMPQLYNVYTLVMDDDRHSLSQMAKLMHEYTGIGFVDDQEPFPEFPEGGVPEPQLAALESVLGYRPKTRMHDAIKQFADWYRETQLC